MALSYCGFRTGICNDAGLRTKEVSKVHLHLAQITDEYRLDATHSLDTQTPIIQQGV
jgi:hypothetical protein